MESAYLRQEQENNVKMQRYKVVVFFSQFLLQHLLSSSFQLLLVL